MDIRVVDSTTGQIIKNFKVREKVSSRSWNLSAGINQISVGNNHFVKTPLGDAARRCITKVVEKFARITAKRPWSGKVVDVEGASLISFIIFGKLRFKSIFVHALSKVLYCCTTYCCVSCCFATIESIQSVL